MKQEKGELVGEPRQVFNSTLELAFDGFSTNGKLPGALFLSHAA